MTTKPVHATDANGEAAVRVSGISKTFGTVKALNDVSLTLRQGTVHALVGENGSGKSTLTKIIAGAYSPDSGTIELEGNVIESVTPRDALAHGVRVIYQDFALFPNMTVAENISFDGSKAPVGIVPSREARARAKKALATLGMTISPNTRLGDLSTAERQLVAIARAVSADGRIILMDEPTAALTQDEIDSFLETVRHLATQGMSFIFISHKLREVVEIADDVTVIRDGNLIATGPAADYDLERISKLMTGTDVLNERRESAWERAEQPIVAARGISLGHEFHDINLELHPGRILGLSGLVGCGKIEIGLALAGLISCDKGTIELNGKPTTNLRSKKEIQYVPDDRLTEGLFLDWSIADNMTVNNLHNVRGKGGLISARSIMASAKEWRSRLRIKAPSVSAPASSLSGGNQQRVLLARTLAPRPKVVIINNPTVGVDVGSRADIHDLIRSVADEGTAVLLVSDEPAELMSLCDEIAFVVQGKIVKQAEATELTEENIIDINGQRSQV